MVRTESNVTTSTHQMTITSLSMSKGVSDRYSSNSHAVAAA